MKKIISLFCVVALLFCMSATIAEAADPASSLADVEEKVNNKADATSGTTDFDSANTSQTIKVGSALYLPVIAVTINQPSIVIVNPYQMEYNESTHDKDSLISAPTTITSTSTIKMKVVAKPTAEKVTGSSVVYASSPIKPTDELTVPTVYIEMKMANFTTAPTTKTDYINNKSNESKATVMEAAGGTPPQASIELDAATTTTPNVYGAYIFDGSSGGPSWGNGDLIKINVLFDINPVIS